ncbi:MAG: hypothetical protein ACYS5V_13115 [Planctomycetota bacterium]
MASAKGSWRLEAGNEWVSKDPFGAVKPADVSEQTCEVSGPDGVALTAARNGYASFRLWVIGSGDYRLSAEADALEVDLFRGWYHKMADGGAHVVDALVPAGGEAAGTLPDPDNAVEGQTHQEYWVDVFVPADAAVGTATGRIVLDAGGGKVELRLTVDVLEAVIPDADAVIADHNCYGCRWVEGMYPSVFEGVAGPRERDEKTVELLHHYYRICHEHRGMLSNLGAGHAGTVDPVYAPTLTGSGRDKSIDDWTLFDLHYGPLVDGSAFASPSPGAPRPRRPARPIWGVYTPINTDWPGDYLYWGQSGFEVEFTRCVGQFDRHFRRKGWTTSRPYFFFNHKKRYRWYEWDGDEPKYAKDSSYFTQMGRLLKLAAGDTPVPWAYRMDASWQMKANFTELAGHVNFFVCGGFAKWYPDEIHAVTGRGDVVWTYSGTPGVAEPSSALLEHVLRMWCRGVGGHCEWLTTNPGPDPWFNCTGAETGMIYPGERFGIAGPVPSCRLKLQRNAVQDVNLIDQAARSAGRLEQARERMAAATGLWIWEDPPQAVRTLSPEDWDNNNLRSTQDEDMAEHAGMDPLWWLPVRRAALGREQAS